MGEFKIDFKNSAYHDLKKIDRHLQAKILNEISNLSKNPLPSDVKKLKGTDSIYRIRIGDYRVIYKIETKIIIIFHIRHRKEAYRF